MHTRIVCIRIDYISYKTEEVFIVRSPSLVDMTSGSIIKKALIFAIPICVGNILQQLYSTVDTLVIGNYCDAAALAAVATSSQPLEILLCIFLGIGSGISILVSQAMGRNDGKRMGRLTSTAVWFLYLCAVPLSVVGGAGRSLAFKADEGAGRRHGGSG